MPALRKRHARRGVFIGPGPAWTRPKGTVPTIADETRRSPPSRRNGARTRSCRPRREARRRGAPRAETGHRSSRARERRLRCGGVSVPASAARGTSPAPSPRLPGSSGVRVERLRHHVDTDHVRELPLEPAQRFPQPPLRAEFLAQCLHRGIGCDRMRAARRVKERGKRLRNRLAHRGDDRPRRGGRRQMADEMLGLPQMMRAGKCNRPGINCA